MNKLKVRLITEIEYVVDEDTPITKALGEQVKERLGECITHLDDNGLLSDELPMFVERYTTVIMTGASSDIMPPSVTELRDTIAEFGMRTNETVAQMQTQIDSLTYEVRTLQEK